MTRPLPYTLTLTADEARTLQWLEDHGYAAGLITRATEDETDDATGIRTLRYTEADAWLVREEAEIEETGEISPDFGACATPSLLRKMYAWLDEIV